MRTNPTNCSKNNWKIWKIVSYGAAIQNAAKR